jgi:dienelactone hydrolase
MLDRLGREAATGGRSGQCAIAAARLCRRIEACSLRSEVEVYPGVNHRFAFPRRATYHHAVERHWAHLLDLFNRALAPH